MGLEMGVGVWRDEALGDRKPGIPGGGDRGRRHPQAPGKGAGELTALKGEGGPLSGAGCALRKGQTDGVGRLCVVVSSASKH